MSERAGRKRKGRWLLGWGLSLALLSSQAQATLRIPRQLNRDEREEVMRAIGLGTSTKLLSDPYPLGGYSGLEMGLGLQTLPTDYLNHMGSQDVGNTPSNFSYQTISIGKGLYNNLDLYADFSPWGESAGISSFGGMLRWSFYQALFLPLHFSLIAQSNAFNVRNAFEGSTAGLDLVTGANYRNFSLYFGLGPVRSWGYFEREYADSGKTEFVEINELHTIIGATAKYRELFFALQMDRYTLSLVSAKVGVRF